MDMKFFPFTMVALKPVVFLFSEQVSPNPSTNFHIMKVWLISWEKRQAPLFSSSRPDIGPGYVHVYLLWKCSFGLLSSMFSAPNSGAVPETTLSKQENKCEYH